MQSSCRYVELYLCRAAVDTDNINISGGDTVTNGDMKMMYCLSEQVIND